MPVGMLIMLPGVTAEQYEQVTERIFGQYPMPPENAPDGLIVHTAGPAEGGWYVYDVWESPEHFRRFAEANVGPAMEEVLGGATPQPQPEFYEIHGLVQVR